MGVGRELHSADNTSWTDNKPARLSSYVEQTPRLTPPLCPSFSISLSSSPLSTPTRLLLLRCFSNIHCDLPTRSTAFFFRKLLGRRILIRERNLSILFSVFLMTRSRGCRRDRTKLKIRNLKGIIRPVFYEREKTKSKEYTCFGDIDRERRRRKEEGWVILPRGPLIESERTGSRSKYWDTYLC